MSTITKDLFYRTGSRFRLFGLFGPEVVEFVDMREALVTFVSRGKKTPGSRIKVRFALPEAKIKKLDLPLQITTTRPNAQAKGTICVGMLLVSEEKLEGLEDLLRGYSQRANLGASGRRSQRLPISLRVMARELPGFGAVSADISQHGIRLACQGALARGTEVRMTVESDTASVENMQLRGRAIWSRENHNGKGYLAGLEFCHLTPEQQETLDRYCRALAARLKGNVMHRQIADGEITVRPTSGDLTPPNS